MTNDADSPADWIENRTYDEIAIGDIAAQTRTLSRADLELFAAVSGESVPGEIVGGAATPLVPSGAIHPLIAHGIWGGSLVAALLGSRLPGPGTVLVGQDLRFLAPVGIGDAVTTTLTVREKRAGSRVVLDCACANQHGSPVIGGSVEVIAPQDKIRRRRGERPGIQLQRHDRYQQLIAACHALEPIATAVVHPCDRESLAGAAAAAEARLIIPILVGPEARIRALAAEAGLDIGPYRLVATPHSHASAAEAVALARAGTVEALMKGSLHTDELMHEVSAHDTGLRTERRLSHVFVLDVPGYPRPLLITDAAINIYPTLADKRDICQNAIELALTLGIVEPKVAVLSAVETVTPKIPSTVDAAALCKMADRGQITGGRIDGPLAFDNAISEDAARLKGIVSPVAGRADILLVPDLEAGNMLSKQLSFLAGADAAGIVLGARLPIILTSRADNLRTRLASCAVAVLLAHARRRAAASPVLGDAARSPAAALPAA